MTWLNFDHAQSSSKKWPQKIKLPQLKFFLEKQLIKFSYTYESLSFCKISKKFLEPIQSDEDNSFLGPFIQNKIFWYKPLLLPSSTYWPFLLGKILKKFWQHIQSYENAPILGPKWSFALNKKKFGKIVNIIFICLLVAFIVQNFTIRY